MTELCRRAWRGELAAPRPGCCGAGVAIPKAGQQQCPTATSLGQAPGSALGGTAGTPDGEKQGRFWGESHLPSPLSLHKQLSSSPGARCWLCTRRVSRATSLEHSLDVALRNVGQTLQASCRGVLGPPLGRASGENTEFPKLLHPAAPVRRVSIVTSACFLRVRDLIYLLKGSVAVRLTAGKQLW